MGKATLLVSRSKIHEEAVTRHSVPARCHTGVSSRLHISLFPWVCSGCCPKRAIGKGTRGCSMCVETAHGPGKATSHSRCATRNIWNTTLSLHSHREWRYSRCFLAGHVSPAVFSYSFEHTELVPSLHPSSRNTLIHTIRSLISLCVKRSNSPHLITASE